MFNKLHRLSFIVVAAVPALMGADGNGCTPPPGPGTGGTTGGGACAAQDARLTSDGECPLVLRSHWDGYGCVSDMGCADSCRGRDCDELFVDKAACQAAYSACPGYVCDGTERTKITEYVAEHRSCFSDADCTSSAESCFNMGCPVYVNVFEKQDLDYLLLQNKFCTTGMTAPTSGCATLCQDPRPPACINGVCSAKPAE